MRQLWRRRDDRRGQGRGQRPAGQRPGALTPAGEPATRGRPYDRTVRRRDDLAVGELHAVRTFRLGPDGRLFPLYDDRPWLPGVNEAVCRRGLQHAAPAPDCRCGFYAYGDLAWVGAQPPSRSVVAVVALWGQVEVASRGVRAGSGRVEAIWLHPRVDARLVDLAAAAYPAAPVYRSRPELLERHPLTQLDGYDPPRLPVRARQLLFALNATVGAAVLAVGSVPASVLARSGEGALLGLGALTACLLAALGGLARRSLAALTAGVVGMGWMLSSTAGSTGAVWASRAPLLAAAAAGGVWTWLDLAAPGRPVPRRGHRIAVRLVPRWPACAAA